MGKQKEQSLGYPSPGEKWVWAVDAFHESPPQQWRAVDALRGLFPKGVAIQPVGCLSLGRYDPSKRVFPRKWNELAASAEKSLKRLLTHGDTVGMLPPRLVRHDTPAVLDSVEALIDFAIREGADGITLTSHARRGPMRFALGSFAENLVLHSPLPVLVVNPRAAIPKKAPKIIFPTDFSEESRLAFERTLRVAAAQGQSIVLFHKLSALFPEVGNVAIENGKARNPVDSVKETIREVSRIWVEDAAKAGVKAEAILDFKPGRTIDSLLKVIKGRGAGSVVALASTSGPIRAVLLGSLARQLLRSCAQPVVIFHAEQESLASAFLNRATQTALAIAAHPPLV